MKPPVRPASASPIFGLATALVLLLAQPAVSQTGSVTGRITDAASGAALTQVQTYLEGTGLGTLSRTDGRFVILNVPTGDYVLLAERIGYAGYRSEITITDGGTVELDFVMVSEALGLDEIVVTGTAGAARRREIGNTIAQVTTADVLESPQNVDALLQGRVAGMQVFTASGNAGSGARIRLRGNVSVAMSNQPIIYVDGVRIRSDGFHKTVPPTGYPGRSGNDVSSPLNSINPSDIERIEVIKGAAATTLYGTEAAAGVIQIFTKRGHRGGAQWTVSVEQGVARLQPFGFPSSERPSWEDATSAAGGTSDFMFIDPWLRNAHQQRYAVSVGGGGESLQYFVSGALEDDLGVLPNDSQRKSNIRGNFTFSPATNLQVQWNTSFTNDQFSNTAAGNNAHGLTLNVYRRSRNYFGNEEKENLDKLLGQEITTQVDHFITGGTATYSPTSNFSNRLSVGYDLAQQNNRNLRPFGFVRAPTGILADNRSEFETLTFDYVGTLSFDLTDAVGSALSFGGQSVTSEVSQTVAYGENFPGPGSPTVTTAGTKLGFEVRERVVNAGFFAQNVFDYRDRYFLTAGMRVDGNSAFGRDFGLQAYPKVSGSWVVSDEEFWSFDGQLKLRAAWGQSGRAPGAFDAVQTYDGVGWGTQPAFYPRVLGNAELGPERTAELEVGFDATLFSDRLALELTYYDQHTTDALFAVRQIPSLGFIDSNGGSSQLENVGEIFNSGIEAVVYGTLFENEAWSFALGATAYTNSSSAGLPEAFAPIAVGGNGWVVDSLPAPIIRGECVENPDEIAEPIIVDDCDYGPNAPTHIFGINTNISMPGGLRFSARGEYQGGHYVTAGVANSAVSRSVIWAGCYDAYSKLSSFEDIANGNLSNWTALERARCDRRNTDSNFWAEKADFFKIREVALMVPVPESLLGDAASSASITVSGRNIFRWTNPDWTHFDPEMGGNNDNNPVTRDGADPGDFLVASISEHIPAPAVWTVALRMVF